MSTLFDSDWSMPMSTFHDWWCCRTARGSLRYTKRADKLYHSILSNTRASKIYRAGVYDNYAGRPMSHSCFWLVDINFLILVDVNIAWYSSMSTLLQCDWSMSTLLVLIGRCQYVVEEWYRTSPNVSHHLPRKQLHVTDDLVEALGDLLRLDAVAETLTSLRNDVGNVYEVRADIRQDHSDRKQEHIWRTRTPNNNTHAWSKSTHAANVKQEHNSMRHHNKDTERRGNSLRGRTRGIYILRTEAAGWRLSACPSSP